MAITTNLDYYMVYLSEELGERAQVIGKMQRFGVTSECPSSNTPCGIPVSIHEAKKKLLRNGDMEVKPNQEGWYEVSLYDEEHYTYIRNLPLYTDNGECLYRNLKDSIYVCFLNFYKAIDIYGEGI